MKIRFQIQICHLKTGVEPTTETLYVFQSAGIARRHIPIMFLQTFRESVQMYWGKINHPPCSMQSENSWPCISLNIQDIKISKL
jgi:hypothetical protein